MKSLKATYHTHSTYCDGNDSIEQLIVAAIEKSFTHIGFSAHSLYPFASPWHMPLASFDIYCAEVRSAAQKYKDFICVYMGFEADYFMPLSMPTYEWYQSFHPDYLIGSLHYIWIENGESVFTADGPEDEVKNGVISLFAGDGRSAVERYFALERAMIASGDFDIVGHIDVIRKRNTALQFFDETAVWYRHEIEKTAEVCATTGKIVEINTGGIGRGIIHDVYPSAEFLHILYKCGVPIVINSDAHSADTLDSAYDYALHAAQKAGYTSSMYLIDGTWNSVPFV